MHKVPFRDAPQMRKPGQNTKFAKIVVKFERRDDGGLRAFSDDVPGFVLSNPDPHIVLDDIVPTLECMLSAMWGLKVVASRLEHISLVFICSE